MSDVSRVDSSLDEGEPQHLANLADSPHVGESNAAAAAQLHAPDSDQRATVSSQSAVKRFLSSPFRVLMTTPTSTERAKPPPSTYTPSSTPNVRPNPFKASPSLAYQALVALAENELNKSDFPSLLQPVQPGQAQGQAQSVPAAEPSPISPQRSLAPGQSPIYHSLNDSVTALAESLRKQNQALRAENAELREQLETHVARVRLLNERCDEYATRIVQLEKQITLNKFGVLTPSRSSTPVPGAGLSPARSASDQVPDHISQPPTQLFTQGYATSPLSASGPALASISETSDQLRHETPNVLQEELNQLKSLLEQTQQRLETTESELSTANATSKYLTKVLGCALALVDVSTNDLVAAQAGFSNQPKSTSKPKIPRVRLRSFSNDLPLLSKSDSSEGEPESSDSIESVLANVVRGLEVLYPQVAEAVAGHRTRYKEHIKPLSPDLIPAKAIDEEGPVQETGCLGESASELSLASGRTLSLSDVDRTQTTVHDASSLGINSSAPTPALQSSDLSEFASSESSASRAWQEAILKSEVKTWQDRTKVLEQQIVELASTRERLEKQVEDLQTEVQRLRATSSSICATDITATPETLTSTSPSQTRHTSKPSSSVYKGAMTPNFRSRGSPQGRGHERSSSGNRLELHPDAIHLESDTSGVRSSASASGEVIAATEKDLVDTATYTGESVAETLVDYAIQITAPFYTILDSLSRTDAVLDDGTMSIGFRSEAPTDADHCFTRLSRKDEGEPITGIVAKTEDLAQRIRSMLTAERIAKAQLESELQALKQDMAKRTADVEEQSRSLEAKMLSTIAQIQATESSRAASIIAERDAERAAWQQQRSDLMIKTAVLEGELTGLRQELAHSQSLAAQQQVLVERSEKALVDATLKLGTQSARISELESELESMQTELRKVQQELSAYRSAVPEHAAMQQQLVDKASIIEQLRTEVQSLQSKLEEFQQANAELQKQASQAEDYKLRLSQSVSELDSRTKTIEQQAQDLHSLKQRVGELQASKSELASKLLETNELNVQIDQLRSDLAMREATIAAQAQRLDDLMQQLKEHQSEKSEVVTGLTAHVDELKLLLEQHKSQLESRESLIAEQKKELQELRKEVEELRLSKADLVTRLNQAHTDNQELSGLSREIECRELRISELVNDLCLSKEQIDTLHASNTDLVSKLSQAECDLQRWQNEANAYHNTVEEQAQSIRALELKVESLTATNHELTLKLTQMETQSTELSALVVAVQSRDSTIAQQTQELEGLRTELKQVQESNQHLITQMSRQDAVILDLQQHLKDTEADRTSLKQDLSEKLEELIRLQSKMDELQQTRESEKSTVDNSLFAKELALKSRIGALTKIAQECRGIMKRVESVLVTGKLHRNQRRAYALDPADPESLFVSSIKLQIDPDYGSEVSGKVSGAITTAKIRLAKPKLEQKSDRERTLLDKLQHLLAVITREIGTEADPKVLSSGGDDDYVDILEVEFERKNMEALVTAAVGQEELPPLIDCEYVVPVQEVAGGDIGPNDLTVDTLAAQRDQAREEVHDEAKMQIPTNLDNVAKLPPAFSEGTHDALQIVITSPTSMRPSSPSSARTATPTPKSLVNKSYTPLPTPPRLSAPPAALSGSAHAGGEQPRALQPVRTTTSPPATPARSPTRPSTRAAAHPSTLTQPKSPARVARPGVVAPQPQSHTARSQVVQSSSMSRHAPTSTTSRSAASVIGDSAAGSASLASKPRSISPRPSPSAATALGESRRSWSPPGRHIQLSPPDLTHQGAYHPHPTRATTVVTTTAATTTARSTRHGRPPSSNEGRWEDDEYFLSVSREPPRRSDRLSAVAPNVTAPVPAASQIYTPSHALGNEVVRSLRPQKQSGGRGNVGPNQSRR